MRKPVLFSSYPPAAGFNPADTFTFWQNGALVTTTFAALQAGLFPNPALPLFTAISSTTNANSTGSVSIIGTGAPGSNLVLPPNYLTPGSGFRVRANGVVGEAGGGPPNLVLRVNLGATMISQTLVGFLSASNPESWELDVSAVCRSAGATGTVQTYGTFTEENSTSPAYDNPFAAQLSTINTTLTQAISVTQSWSVANAANTFTCNMLTITPILAP